MTALCILISLVALPPTDTTSLQTGPAWSDYTGFERVDGIIFRWRMIPTLRRGDENFFQFEFENETEKPIHFTYIIAINSGRRSLGSMTLPPKRSRLSGAYHVGTLVQDVEVVDPATLNKMLEDVDH